MYTESQVHTEKECKIVSRGFHSYDELREMEEHPGKMSRHIGRTKPYDCSYPQFSERPRIPEPYRESEEDHGK